eukprot:CAMPEP_0183406742 /NCGR_PEP_ID=MMETSP0370-20130417/16837_1 /TAXON_ID=268820 /ORGANISM="Peridinium aciculiferum, Strain PAER-2" /LENGTH=37 /DNA_ID= /DNA_START= /DNA_END= /DNA_ORIENTATION=
MSCVTDWPRMEALILAALSTCTMAGDAAAAAAAAAAA